MESLKTDVMVHGVQIAQNRPKIHQLGKARTTRA
jgi:hypothetical protein